MSPTPVPGCPDTYYADVPMIGLTGTNSAYVLDTPEPAIVDCGTADGVDALFDALAAVDLDPEDVSYIVPTHAHLDHAGGLGELAQACERATVFCHRRGLPYLTDESKLEHLANSVERAIGFPAPYGEPTVVDPSRCRALSGGETIDLGDRILDVVDAPGHAPHQVCLYDRTADTLFSADANGMRLDSTGHRPTTPPPDFDLEAALDTLERLESFEPETVLYAHFGPGEPGRGLAELREYRELLPTYVEAVAAAREACGTDVSAIAAAMDERWAHWSLEADIAGILRYLDKNA